MRLHARLFAGKSSQPLWEGNAADLRYCFELFLWGRLSETVSEFSFVSRSIQGCTKGGKLIKRVTLSRNEDSLVLSINDTSDTLTVFNCFMDDSDANQIEQIRFADGTTWNIDKVKQRLLQPTGGDDVIIGYSGSDTLQGLGGDDLLPNLDRTTYVLECAA